MTDAAQSSSEASSPAVTAPAATAASPAESLSLQRAGVAYGLAAYGMWGLAPVYFKSVTRYAPPREVLAHRILWSVVLLVILMTVLRQWRAARDALRSARTVWMLVGSTILVAANWYAYIWATANGRIVEGSLGYFINPLVNVLLGTVFLGERLRPKQKASVALAACGVGVMTVGMKVVPSVALFLAGTFAFYGLLRKRVAAGALVGLTVETVFLAPLALAYLTHLTWSDAGHFGTVSRRADVLLAFSGLMTSIPLLCFAAGARRLRLATMGILQYLAPTLQLIVGVLLYHEPFTRVHAASFGLIWAGLAMYSVDAIFVLRRSRPGGDRT